MIASKRPAFGLCQSCPSEFGKRRRGHIYRCDRCQQRPAKKPVKRFADKRDAPYAAYIRSLPCTVRGKEGRRQEGGKRLRWVHECDSPSECCHVRSRAAGGEDRGNTIPLCRRAHNQQHQLGIESVGAAYGIDQSAEAERLDAEYASGGAPV